MIIYKRKITSEDIGNLKNNEKLIYYKTEDIAITIDKVDDKYLVRKKEISNDETIEEIILKTVDKTLKLIEN